MATLVGSAGRVSTWGKFRCVMAYNDNIDYYTNSFYGFNIHYLSGVKSAADGSGLIRYVPWERNLSPRFRQPFISDARYSPSPGISANQLYTFPPVYTSPLDFTESMAATIEVQNELTGETVTFTNGMTTTILPVLWSNNRQTWRTGVSVITDVASVGKLVAF